MSSRIKILKILELFWLIMGCFALGGFIYKAISEGMHANKNYMLLFISCISFLMFVLRRKKRKFLEDKFVKEEDS